VDEDELRQICEAVRESGFLPVRRARSSTRGRYAVVVFDEQLRQIARLDSKDRAVEFLDRVGSPPVQRAAPGVETPRRSLPPPTRRWDSGPLNYA
jgi:hypothetical protein